MIIQALTRYYDILAADEGCAIPRLGYSTGKVSFVLQISHEGKLVHIIDIRTTDKKPRAREMTVPKQDARANKISPYFLCDNAKYIFGVDFVSPKEREKFLAESTKVIAVLEDTGTDLIAISRRTQGCFQAFKELHHSVLDGISIPEVKMFLAFIDSWKPESFLENEKIQQYKEDIRAGASFIFEVSGSYLHTIPIIRNAWERSCSCENDGDSFTAQCMITGEPEPISQIHQKIKGVVGAQSAGASLVSFNDPAYCSYGKEQSYNAPIGKTAEFKYSTMLNFLLADKHNRIQIGETTVVFWAERSDSACEDLAQLLFYPPTGSEEPGIDTPQQGEQVKDIATIQLIRDILSKVRCSEPVRSDVIGVNPDTRFYILGLSPNNARIAVRFWHQDSFGGFISRVAQHHLDLEIVKGDFGPPFVSVYRLLQESIPQVGEKTEVPPILGGLLMTSILNGTPYPIQMFYAVLNRVKVERQINFVRAGFIKAYLLRQIRSGMSVLEENLITMSLNRESRNVAYRLGRLFAVLEKVQSETNKEMGSTITSKYFSSASATPAVVFPVLLKLAQHHIAKSDWGFKTTQDIEEILSEVNEFPAFLSLEEQGMFMLGYYHQKQSFFEKKVKIEEESR
jgi:CRISPR-associated protein Csd1